MSGLLRVRSSRTPYRRAGIAFGNLPLVLGPEHFAQGIEGLRQLAAIVGDPVLKVQVSDADTPDVFRPIADGDRDAIVGAAAAAAQHDNPEAAQQAAAMILSGIVGEVEPAEDPAERERAELLVARLAEEDRVAAEAAKAEEDRVAAEAAKAEEDRVAAEAAKAEEDRVAAEAAKAEEDRVAAEAAKAEEDRVAAEAAKEGAPGVEVAPGVVAPVSMGTSASQEPTSKEAPAPAAAKAKADAKPARSSGRKPAAASKGAKG